MSNIKTKKGTIGILTGGGDVPGLNPAIRAVTIRAIREGYRVIGIKRGWGGMIDIVRKKDYDNSENFMELTENIVNRAGRKGSKLLSRKIKATDNTVYRIGSITKTITGTALMQSRGLMP